MRKTWLLLILVFGSTFSFGQSLYGYYISKAQAHLQYGEFDKASYFIEKGIKMYPDSSELYIVRAFKYHYMDSADNSIADLIKAKEMGSKSEFIPKFLGLNYDDKGDNKLATENYEEYLSIVPEDTSIVICLVMSLAKEGFYTEAEEKVLEFQSSYPKSAAPIMLRGLINFERKDYLKAIEFFTKYIRLCGGADPYGYLHRAYAYKELGMMTEMCEDFWSIRWDYITQGSRVYRDEGCEKILNRVNSPPPEEWPTSLPPSEEHE